MGLRNSMLKNEHYAQHRKLQVCCKVSWPPFEKANNVKVDVISGSATGKVLKLGKTEMWTLFLSMPVEQGWSG